MRRREQVIEIGDEDGRIALYLNEPAAIDLAHTFGPSDSAYNEIMDAVERAYPVAASAASEEDDE